MKATLEFNLPEEKEEFEFAQKGSVYKYQLDEIWERIFRPRYKNGYSNEILQECVETAEGRIIIDELEKIYQEIVSE